MKKIIIGVVVALVAAGGAYKTVLAKPAPAPKPKVEGDVYVLPKEFLVNLADGKYAKVSVALVIEAAAGGGHAEAGATPPEGYGTEPQEAVVRDIITNALTDAAQRDLISAKGREHLKKQLLKAIKKHTDVHVHEVLLPDVTVQ